MATIFREISDHPSYIVSLFKLAIMTQFSIFVLIQRH